MTYGIFLVVVLVVVFFIYSTSGRSLNGVWSAPADYLAEAGLGMFELIIDDKACYIYAKKANGETILNQSSVFITSWDWSSLWNKCLVYNVNMKDVDAEYFPAQQKLYYYHKIEKLMLVADEQVKGVFYKMCESSEKMETMKAERTKYESA